MDKIKKSRIIIPLHYLDKMRFHSKPSQLGGTKNMGFWWNMMKSIPPLTTPIKYKFINSNNSSTLYSLGLHSIPLHTQATNPNIAYIFHSSSSICIPSKMSTKITIFAPTNKVLNPCLKSFLLKTANLNFLQTLLLFHITLPHTP